MDDRTIQLDLALVEYLDRCDAGEVVDTEQFLAKYKEVADELRLYFQTADMVESALLDGTQTRKANVRPKFEAPRLPARFSYVARLGQGGMGVVYGAIQLDLNRRVALKTLPNHLLDDALLLSRFRTEALAWSQFTSSRVLPVYEVFEHEGVPFISSPWIDGVDLAKIIRQRDSHRELQHNSSLHTIVQASEKEYVESVLRVFDQVIEALVALDANRVVHRDIKPSNILVSHTNEAWLADFGLAKLAEGKTNTADGDVLGTRGYMSPEQGRGANVDGRSDIFSMGASIYHALTLRMPYGRATITEDTELPVRPSQVQRWVTKELDTVVMTAIHPCLAHRYRSAAAFRSDWARARAGLTPLARPPGVAWRVLRQLTRRRLFALLAGGVGSILLARTWVWPNDPMAPRRVRVPTLPDGASLTIVPRSPSDGRAISGKTIDVSAESRGEARLAPGDYLIRARLPDGRFHEVFRHVPFPSEWWTPNYRHLRFSTASEVVELPSIKIEDVETTGMVPITKEGTVADAFPVAYTGELANGNVDAVAGVGGYLSCTYDDAVAIAERMGKRLPTEQEAAQLRFPEDDHVDVFVWTSGWKELVKGGGGRTSPAHEIQHVAVSLNGKSTTLASGRINSRVVLWCVRSAPAGERSGS